MIPDNSKNEKQNKFEFLLRESLKRNKKREIEALIHKRKRNNTFKLLIGMAASIVFLAGTILGYKFLSPESPKELAGRYIKELSLQPPPNYRSLDDYKRINTLQAAYDEMSNENYSEAVQKFRQYEKTHTLSNLEKLNYAFCIIKIRDGDLQKSKSLLSSINNAESGIEINRLYLLGLNEVLLDNTDEAVNIFEELLKRSGFNKKNINSILKTLK